MHLLVIAGVTALTGLIAYHLVGRKRLPSGTPQQQLSSGAAQALWGVIREQQPGLPEWSALLEDERAAIVREADQALAQRRPLQQKNVQHVIEAIRMRVFITAAWTGGKKS